MHSAALWATVLASEGGAPGNTTVPVASTLPVAIIGGVSLIAVALVPEFFRWLRRHAPEATAAVTPAALEATEARISSTVEVRMATALERANSARAEVRALRKAMEARDEQLRTDLQTLRDEVHRQAWTRGDGGVPAPREPAG